MRFIESIFQETTVFPSATQISFSTWKVLMTFIIYLMFRIFYYGHFAMVQTKPQNEIMFMRNCNGLKVKLLSPCYTEFFSQMKVVRPIRNTRWWDTFNGSRISLKEKVFSTSYYLRARAYSMYYLLLSSLLL